MFLQLFFRRSRRGKPAAGEAPDAKRFGIGSSRTQKTAPEAGCLSGLRAVGLV